MSPALMERAETFAQRLETFVARRALWLGVVWGVVVLAVGIAVSSVRPFWFDEIFTYEMARPDARVELLGQLRNGMDQQPPPFYWVTRLAFLFSGNEHIAARLPAMFGFWLMTVCVYRFAQRRGGALMGIFAAGITLNTLALRYLIEARPYALLMGFSALALVSWQAATEPGRSLWSLVGITASIAAAVSSSYYAVLILAPLAFAELVRTAVRYRREGRWVDIPVWVALGLGGATSLIYVPLVRAHVRQLSVKSWATPHPLSFVKAYEETLGSLSMLILAAGIVICLYVALSSKTAASAPQRRLRLSLPEAAAAAGFALIPVIGFIVAVFWTRRYNSRYVLEGVVGIAIVLAAVAWSAVRGSALAGWCLILAVIFGSAVNAYQRFYYGVPSSTRNVPAVSAMVSGQPADLPIAMDEPLSCLEMMHYGPPGLSGRLVFLVDVPIQTKYAAVPYEGDTWLTMTHMWPGVHVESLAPFLRQHRSFLLLDNPSELTYLVPYLLAQRAELRVAAVNGRLTLYQVTLDPASS